MREYEERRLETWRELAEASEPPRYGEMRDEMMSILLPYGARDESTRASRAETCASAQWS